MYRLRRFGDGDDTTLLNIYNRAEDMGPGQAIAALINTAGGWYDPRGTGRSRLDQKRISLGGLLYESDMLAAIQALAIRLGERDKLYRQTSANAWHWAWARLTQDSMPSDFHNHTLPTQLQFVLPGVWQADNYHHWYLDAGEYFDAGLFFDGTDWANIGTPPNTRTITASGNIRQGDVILRVKPGGATMTNFNLTCTALGIDLDFDDTVADDDTLEINSATMAVTNDAAAAYSGLSLGPDHTLDRWLAVDPGDNDFIFNWTGPSYIRYQFEFLGAWA